jgi:hypothetical protein
VNNRIPPHPTLFCTLAEAVAQAAEAPMYRGARCMQSSSPVGQKQAQIHTFRGDLREGVSDIRQLPAMRSDKTSVLKSNGRLEYNTSADSL